MNGTVRRTIRPRERLQLADNGFASCVLQAGGCPNIAALVRGTRDVRAYFRRRARRRALCARSPARRREATTAKVTQNHE